MAHVSGSKHSYERLRCHMWQFRVWKMRKLERKSRFLTRFSFLDWREKSTKFCRVFSAFIPSCDPTFYNNKNHKNTAYAGWALRATMLSFRSCAWKHALAIVLKDIMFLYQKSAIAAEKQWKPKAELNSFKFCWGAFCVAGTEKQWKPGHMAFNSQAVGDRNNSF